MRSTSFFFESEGERKVERGAGGGESGLAFFLSFFLFRLGPSVVHVHVYASCAVRFAVAEMSIFETINKRPRAVSQPTIRSQKKNVTLYAFKDRNI